MVAGGAFAAAFCGAGLEFDETRPYEPGDDARTIDRNVSARFGAPYVRRYREERGMPVVALVDGSASMRAGALGALTRYEQALFAAVLVAFSAEHAGLQFGGLVFDAGLGFSLAAGRGERRIMRFVEALLAPRTTTGGTALKEALDATLRRVRRRSLVFIASDFCAADWAESLGRLCARHWCVACRVSDPLDCAFPTAAGLATLVDAENGRSFAVDTTTHSFRAAWAAESKAREQNWREKCQRAGAARLSLSTDADALGVLRAFFRNGTRR
jgi:uncharacterized protein (DUF58 family)